MASIKGYKFTTEQEILQAQKDCDDFYGFPITPESVTKHYVGIFFAEFNFPQFWFFLDYPGLVPVLGPPIEFEVNPDPIGKSRALQP